jgi:hypothetical protein
LTDPDGRPTDRDAAQARHLPGTTAGRSAGPFTPDGRSPSPVFPERDAVAFDETDVGWGELPDPGDRDDERILREVPPHHLWA